MQPTMIESDSQPSLSPQRQMALHVEKIISEAGALLPMPGPLTAFGFLNTLQGLEHLPFDEGMRKGARLYGCEPYLSESRYRQKLARGRILPADLSAVLWETLGNLAEEFVGSLATRFRLRLAMLQHPLHFGSPQELRWFVETEAFTRLAPDAPPDFREKFIEDTRHWLVRDLNDGDAEQQNRSDHGARQLLADLIPRFGDSAVEGWHEPTEKWEGLSLKVLWRVCCDVAARVDIPRPARPSFIRHRDALKRATGEDSDVQVNDLLIRFCAAFADQGLARTTLPYREAGFFQAFCKLYGSPGGPPERWRKGLTGALADLQRTGMTAAESVLESLRLLGVAEEEWEDFIQATLLALPGWAGMLWQMETRSDRVPLAVPQGTLVEYLAVRLILEQFALSSLASESLNYHGPLAGLRRAATAKIEPGSTTSVEQRAMNLFQLAQVLGWSPPALYRLGRHHASALFAEIEGFSELERRWVFHQAFERRLRIRALDAISLHGRRPPEQVAAPRFQAMFCLDAREESFRRHIEELAPDVETFGAAGFFGVAMYYRGVADAHFAALCPIVVKPQHWVVEDAVYTHDELNRRRAKTRRALGTATHQVHLRSRSVAGGMLLTAGVGVLASFPLVARVLFPRLTARIRRQIGGLVAAPSSTRLRLERIAETPGPEDGQIGYTVEEMAGTAERMLRDTGLTSNFARLVLFFGHCSSSLNNPHKSAYDCGACTGNAGGPNARALAAMLNDVRVRELLAEQGLEIPHETVFLGGLHNTAAESVKFFDLELLPKSHFRDFDAAREILEHACRRNAHERCRRFDSAPTDLSFEAAHRHVEDRSEDLAQTRAEFGNASNALCFVGRRARVRGLFLDRRCFLTSYDPTQDDAEQTILARILSAVVPVCEGINMQYNLSYIDSGGWGCGSKLPHNVASLLGVMNGAASDLRSGLPWQGVEIHEPVRLLFVIETAPQAMLDIMERNPVIGRILKNGWAQLALLDPHSAQLQEFKNGDFVAYDLEAEELPRASSSTTWYHGWRDHLEFAAIGN